MQSVVWSQPIARRKLRRCHSRPETPSTFAGKTVLGVGIALTMTGGLLAVLGLTGYFVRGGNKYFLGFGVVVGIASLLTGLTGTRSVSRRAKTKKYIYTFIFLAILCLGTAIAMIVMGILVLYGQPTVLLTSVIAASETTIAVVVTLLSSCGSTVACKAREELTNPSISHGSGETARDLTPATDRYRLTIPPSDNNSPDTAIALVSDGDQV